MKKLAVTKLQGNEERPFIHLTFLDAYTRTKKDSGEEEDSGVKKGYGYLEGYPEHYSEHYVDIIGLSGTDAILANAFNFDITLWSHYPWEGGFFGHSWPVNWYIKSITAPEPEFTYLRYGYPLSREGGNHQFINVMGQLYPPPSSNPSDSNRGLIRLHVSPILTSLGVPVITEFVVPQSITGDGQSVIGTVKFTDVDGGIAKVPFEALGDTCGGCGTSWDEVPEISHILGEGQFELEMWCTASDYNWFASKKVTLRDNNDNVSNPYIYLFECIPPSGSLAR